MKGDDVLEVAIIASVVGLTVFFCERSPQKAYNVFLGVLSLCLIVGAPLAYTMYVLAKIWAYKKRKKNG